MLERLGSPLARSKRDTLLAFEGVEGDLQSKYPTMLYSDILAHVHAEMKRRISHKSSLAEPDSAAAGSVETSDGSAHLERAGTSASADEPTTSGLEEEDIDQTMQPMQGEDMHLGFLAKDGTHQMHRGSQ